MWLLLRVPDCGCLCGPDGFRIEVPANGVVTKLTRGYPANALDSGAANNPPL
jgi:hypothetical protein